MIEKNYAMRRCIYATFVILAPNRKNITFSVMKRNIQTKWSINETLILYFILFSSGTSLSRYSVRIVFSCVDNIHSSCVWQKVSKGGKIWSTNGSCSKWKKKKELFFWERFFIFYCIYCFFFIFYYLLLDCVLYIKCYRKYHILDILSASHMQFLKFSTYV